MKSYEMLDDDALCDELLRNYLEPKYYLATKRPLVCVATPKIATTLDEYIKLLTEGYINVEIFKGLDNYVDKLLENEWFHKWPLAYWIYVHRTFDRKTTIDYNKKQFEENVDAEIRALDVLAKEGWPGAMADIGRCGIIGRIPGKSFEQCVCMWIYAYRKGYRAAGGYLLAASRMNEYSQLCDEVKMFVLEGATAWHLEDYGVTESNYKDTLDGWPLKRTKELLNERKRTRKIVVERALMRETIGRLSWPEGESPYEINFK